MRSIFRTTALLLALTGPGGMKAAAAGKNTCDKKYNLFYSNQFTIHMEEVDDAPDICHWLWTFLEIWPLCLASKPSCGWNSTREDGTGQGLKWDFEVSMGCNGGMVNSAFWEATENEWGSVHCRQ